MKINIKKKSGYNTPTLLKKCGYHFTGVHRGEQGFARRAGSGRYPQFHIYINEDSQDKIVLNLHLDAKKPSYAGSKMHAGEYDTEVVKKEAERVKEIFADLT